MIKVDFVSVTMGWAIDSNQIWKTEDGGISWIEQFYPIPLSPIYRSLSSIDMVDEIHGVITLYNNNAPSSIEAFLITNDGGQTWEEKMPGSYILFSAIMTDDGQVFGSGQYSGVFYSNDWGNSFVELPSGEIDFSQFQYLGNNEVVALGLQGSAPWATRAISISENSGQSWTHNLLPDAYYYTSGFHFFNANEGFLCGFGGFLAKTEDGGQTWQEIEYGDDRKAKKIYFVDDQIGWAVGENGLVISTTDGGNTWVAENCGGNYTLRSISALDAENCWLSSNASDGKYLKFDPDAVVDCSPSNNNELNIDNTNLLIFPNPAFETVTISLENSSAFIASNRVVIFNNLGQNIYEESILNERLVINTIAWNPGIYWVKLFKEEQFLKTEKLIILD